MQKSGQTRPVGSDRDIPAGWFEPSIHTSYFRIFAKMLEDRNLPTPRPPVGQPRLLPVIDLLPSFDAADTASNPLIGIEVGLAIPGGAHGAMGMAAISSPTLGDAIEAVVHFVPMRNSLFSYQVVRSKASVALEILPRLELHGYTRFLQYATSVAILNIFKAISESQTVNEGILCFPWPKPKEMSGIRSELTQCFRFGATSLKIEFPAKVSERPSQTADFELHRLMTMAGEEELKKISGSVAARIRQLINAHAPRWPTLDEVAAQIAISRRTLARRLSAENLGYQDLIDEARNELACWYLRQTTLPIGEIVERAGFSEMSNFSRGFKRLQGVSPREYRNRFRANSAD
jgi:AraC-like DNA-binding protein